MRARKAEREEKSSRRGEKYDSSFRLVDFPRIHCHGSRGFLRFGCTPRRPPFRRRFSSLVASSEFRRPCQVESKSIPAGSTRGCTRRAEPRRFFPPPRRASVSRRLRGLRDPRAPPACIYYSLNIPASRYHAMCAFRERTRRVEYSSARRSRVPSACAF